MVVFHSAVTDIQGAETSVCLALAHSRQPEPQYGVGYSMIALRHHSHAQVAKMQHHVATECPKFWSTKATGADLVSFKCKPLLVQRLLRLLHVRSNRGDMLPLQPHLVRLVLELLLLRLNDR